MHRILVVDDELEIVRIIEEFLTKNGFDVLATSEPEKAVEILNSDTNIDLMILDMRMPKIKGMDILALSKQTRKDIPVIILTGSIDAQDSKLPLEHLGYSLDDICYKPIDLQTLLDTVKNKLALIK